jgi:predicted O-methyltransferase YrrM
MTDAAEVDAFLAATLVPDDPVLDTADLPPISVSPPQGKLLSLLARALGARRILEVGTLAGYSAIWLARALPADGSLVTLEFSPHHAEVARANIAAAGLSSRVTVLVGPALETLPGLEGPFDLVFIDADKTNNVAYLDWAVRLGRPGTVIVLDNVVRRGEILSPEADANAAATRAALEWLGSDPRVDATAIQMVGVKGWDGMAFAVVR